MEWSRSDGWLLGNHLFYQESHPRFFLASVELGNKVLSLGFTELVIWNGKELVGMNAIDHLFCRAKLTVLHASS